MLYAVTCEFTEGRMSCVCVDADSPSYAEYLVRDHFEERGWRVVSVDSESMPLQASESDGERFLWPM